jgi:hypothetical protein
MEGVGPEFKRISRTRSVSMFVPLKSVLALVAGIIALVSPKAARVAVAAYLIALGVLGLLGK